MKAVRENADRSCSTEIELSCLLSEHCLDLLMEAELSYFDHLGSVSTLSARLCLSSQMEAVRLTLNAEDEIDQLRVCGVGRSGQSYRKKKYGGATWMTEVSRVKILCSG